MKDNIAIVDSATGIHRIETSSRVFERIALASPGDWLPLYYQTFSLLRIAQLSLPEDSVKTKTMISASERLFKKMDSIPVLRNELQILKIFKNTIKAKVISNPTQQKELLKMVTTGADMLRLTDSNNIRSLFVRAYILEVNNKQEALALLAKVMNNTSQNIPLANEFYPHWGLEVSKQLKLQIEKKLSLKMPPPIEICFLAQGDEKDPRMKNIAMGPMPANENITRYMKDLKAADISVIVCLVTDEELKARGQDSLIHTYKANGFEVLHFPIPDMQVPDEKDLRLAMNWIHDQAEKKKVYIHCKAGLGRSGLVSGCLLVSFGYDGEEAIKAVRRARSPEAIETAEQQEFVRKFVK